MKTKVVRNHRGNITIIIGGKAYGFADQLLPDILFPGSAVVSVLAGDIDADSAFFPYDESYGPEFSVEALSECEDLTEQAAELIAGLGLKIVDVEPEEPKP